MRLHIFREMGEWAQVVTVLAVVGLAIGLLLGFGWGAYDVVTAAAARVAHWIRP